MMTVPIILFTLSCLVSLVWISRHVQIFAERKNGILLSADHPGPPSDPPRIDMFVAAKDEEENIEVCVRSLLDQDYPNFHLTICNDRSDDRTGEIVAKVAAEDSRLTLLNIENLPDGWCGKNNAMQTGIAGGDSEWICMSDADCTQTSSRTISTAMQYAVDNDVDLLSVLPNLKMHGFWENVIQPVCSGVMMIWFNPDKVNSPTKRNAYANGAFMLMKRSAYEAIGTHEAVKDQVNEDMHMASRVKQAGLNLKVIRNDGLYNVRMYTSLPQTLRGWGRIFYGTFGTHARLRATLSVLLIMGLLPYFAAVLGLSLAGLGGWWLACGIAGAFAATMQVSVIYRFYKLIGACKELAWTYPLGAIMAITAVFIAMSKLRKGAQVVWRGTSYSKDSKA